MLHKCENCAVLYLVSDHYHLCNPCGVQLQQQVERLYERDDVVEWWVVCSWAMFRRSKQAEIEWPEG